MIYCTGTRSIDPEAYEIRCGDGPVPVEPQVFDLIVMLIRNRDRVVSKDEIIGRIWNGRIVSDATLNSRVAAARKALGDDGSAQKLIRTIHGRGFRFVGDLAEIHRPEVNASRTPLVKRDGSDSVVTRIHD